MISLRVACAFRTVSYEAVCVISGMLPIDILAEKQQRIYKWYDSNQQTRSMDIEKEREISLAQWQECWENSSSGRWTYRLIPKIKEWVNQPRGEIDYYLTQILSGHGCF